jgi:hypothetical protein
MCPRLSTEFSAGLRMRPARALPGRKLADETVLVDPRARKVFLMNPVGAVVWGGIERGATAGEIIAEVVARFRVEAPQAEVDVQKFLVELEAAGLAEVVS